MSAVPKHLTYARREPPRWRSINFAVVFAALVVSNLWFAVSKWRVQAVDNWSFYREQKRCLHFQQPADHLVVELHSDEKRVIVDDTARLLFANVLRRTDQWMDYSEWGWPQQSFISPQATVFLHERYTPSGKPRLIAVNTGLKLNDSNHALSFRTMVLKPAPLFGKPIFRSDFDDWSNLKLWNEPGGFLDGYARLYAGQPDPINLTRFTMSYESQRGRGTIEGLLQDDDSIEFRAMDGPLLNAW